MTIDDTRPYLHHKTAWLPGVGLHGGKPAGELRSGDRLVWSYGRMSTVVAVREITDVGITIVERSDSNGQDYERRLAKKRIVAIEGMHVHDARQQNLRSGPGRTFSCLIQLLRQERPGTTV